MFPRIGFGPINILDASIVKAILSDIHGNIEALDAVLTDIARKEINEIYCPGDIVGYGQNPIECIDCLMSLKGAVCLLGNHDQAALFGVDDCISPAAEKSSTWTRKQLESGANVINEWRMHFLGELPRTHREGQFQYVHGSPRNLLNEYVFPEDIHNQRKMERIFALVDQYCFCGHTHVPGVFTESLNFFSPKELDFTYELGPAKVLINVGSVGQPRDGDWRASYVIVDENLVHFQRVEYDIDRTIQKPPF